MFLQEVQLYQLDRHELERLALMRVCACQYYDLADCLAETTDRELLDIINHDYRCTMCGLKGAK